MSESELQKKLETLAQEVLEINICAFYDTNGQTLAFYSKIRIVDEGEKMRYAATTLACSALANRTLSTLTKDQVQFLVVKGEHASAGIGVNKKYYLLVITDKAADIRKITLNLLNIIN